MSPRSESQALRGTSILIVEDEPILALDVAFILEDEGASVTGPIYRLDEAMSVDIARIDAAIVDVDIAGKEVFPLTDRLRASNIAIVFHTGRLELVSLRNRYPEARFLPKPSLPRQIVHALSRAVPQPDGEMPQIAAS